MIFHIVPILISATTQIITIVESGHYPKRLLVMLCAIAVLPKRLMIIVVVGCWKKKPRVCKNVVTEDQRSLWLMQKIPFVAVASERGKSLGNNTKKRERLIVWYREKQLVKLINRLTSCAQQVQECVRTEWMLACLFFSSHLIVEKLRRWHNKLVVWSFNWFW